jgi:CO/xanthine dehydrogenase FAD-binding subunit
LRYNTLSANDWPCLGVAAFLTKANDRCRELRVALGGLASTPVLVGGLDFIKDQTLDAAVIERLLDTVDEQIAPFADLRGSEWYKRRMARLFVKKAVEQLSGAW